MISCIATRLSLARGGLLILGLVAWRTNFCLASDGAAGPSASARVFGAPAASSDLCLPLQIPSHQPSNVQSSQPPFTTVGLHRRYGAIYAPDAYYRPYHSRYAPRPYLYQPYYAYRPWSYYAMPYGYMSAYPGAYWGGFYGGPSYGIPFYSGPYYGGAYYGGPYLYGRYPGAYHW